MDSCLAYRPEHCRSYVSKQRLAVHGAIEDYAMREPTHTACALSAGNWPVASVRSLEPGTHLVTPRRGYAHHGIYVGQGKVVQYGGLVRGLHRGPVEEVGLEQFACGRPMWMRYDRESNFDADEIVRRARSRVGENRYHLLTNNCEHFCEWCVHAEHRSYQVDGWLGRRNRALQIAWEVLGRFAHIRSIGTGSLKAAGYRLAPAP